MLTPTEETSVATMCSRSRGSRLRRPRLRPWPRSRARSSRSAPSVSRPRGKKAKESLFREVRAPSGQAELFIDKASRACILRRVRVETHCKGKVGWVINRVAPLLAKTYSDAVLIRMPARLRLTVESVRGGTDWIELGGKIDWKAGVSTATENASHSGDPQPLPPRPLLERISERGRDTQCLPAPAPTEAPRTKPVQWPLL
jgi:hypothetical protein